MAIAEGRNIEMPTPVGQLVLHAVRTRQEREAELGRLAAVREQALQQMVRNSVQDLRVGQAADRRDALDWQRALRSMQESDERIAGYRASRATAEAEAAPFKWRGLSADVETGAAAEPALPLADEDGGSGALGKITSYGYGSDPLGDSASLGRGKYSRPTGAWDNALKPGSFAVSPDIEEQFKKAGIKPQEPVALQLSDGSMFNGVWADRTAQDSDVASGRIKGMTKPLRGRFDLFSPEGVHALEGRQVVGFRPARALSEPMVKAAPPISEITPTRNAEGGLDEVVSGRPTGNALIPDGNGGFHVRPKVGGNVAGATGTRDFSEHMNALGRMLETMEVPTGKAHSALISEARAFPGRQRANQTAAKAAAKTPFNPDAEAERRGFRKEGGAFVDADGVKWAAGSKGFYMLPPSAQKSVMTARTEKPAFSDQRFFQTVSPLLQELAPAETTLAQAGLNLADLAAMSAQESFSTIEQKLGRPAALELNHAAQVVFPKVESLAKGKRSVASDLGSIRSWASSYQSRYGEPQATPEQSQKSPDRMPQASPPAGGIAAPQSKADFDALPSGALYTRNGRTYRKP